MTKIKTKNFKKLITIILILLSLSIIISPVSAITENIDYESDIFSGTITTSQSSYMTSSNTLNIPLRIAFPAIHEWIQIKVLIYGVDHPEAGQPGYVWSVQDINQHTSETPVIYKLGGVEISSGLMQFIRHTDSEGALTSGILTFTFDTPLNTRLSGNQLVEVSYSVADTNLVLRYPASSPTVDDRTHNCPQVFARDYFSDTWDSGFGIEGGVGYKYSTFHHSFTYDYTDESNNDIYLDYNRLGYTSSTIITGESDIILYQEISAEDFYFDSLFDIPYNINITNPAYIGIGEGEFFEYTIPKIESPPPPPPPTPPGYINIDWYAFNAEIPSEKLPVNYTLEKYNITTDEWIPQQSGKNPSTIVMTIPIETYYNLSVTKPNFVTNNFNFYGIESEHFSIEMFPDYGDNFSVTFTVTDYITGERISEAQITANGETKYTSILGNIGFGDIIDGITYEISKPGYVTTTGYKPITENTRLWIYMIPDEEIIDTVTIDWYTYNAEIPSQHIGVNYILNKYSITNDEWSLQESGYNPSTLDMEIPVETYYNLTTIANGFITTDFKFYATKDEHLSIKMFPSYGDNFSVAFLVSDYQERRLESAKIIANGITKYTSILGTTGFGNIVDQISYVVSKPGYISISGEKEITKNEQLYIFLQTEDEALITSTPIPPDITKPTNLLESIQYAFQKMFGLTSSTEDMETANLFMGLGVIFAGAVLIASITKDALGAVVGGLIGFIMSLALGFIPIWVVFVGFSAFAIYIILTKTGGTA